MKKLTFVKLLSILALAALVVWTSPSERTDRGEVIRIGILNLADHGSLEAARLGFVSRLEELGYVDGANIEINYLNAQSDQSNLPVMSQRLVADQSDLILAISTPAAQAIANETQEIPILTTAVTSLETANLVESNERPNTNVSGTSDMAPVAEQLALLKKLAPRTETIGFIYNSSEANSQLQVNIAEEEASKLGLSTVRMSVTNTNDVAQTMQALVGRVDALYIPSDNTLSAAMATVGSIAKENRIPVVTGSAAAAMVGGLGTVGIDYYKLGQQTADMAIDIFENGAEPQTMPVQTQSDTQIFINEEMAEAIGITIPEELRGRE